MNSPTRKAIASNGIRKSTTGTAISCGVVGWVVWLSKSNARTPNDPDTNVTSSTKTIAKIKNKVFFVAI